MVSLFAVDFRFCCLLCFVFLFGLTAFRLFLLLVRFIALLVIEFGDLLVTVSCFNM